MNNKKIKNNTEEREFEQQAVDIARVTRVTAGGKRLRFRACVVIGDKKGRVAAGVAKGADVSIAINKAIAVAKKDVITIPMVKKTIPYKIKEKYKSAYILLKPAPEGTGVKAGGPMRVVLELGGVENVVGKILGSNNKINNIRATINALRKLRRVELNPKLETRN